MSRSRPPLRALIAVAAVLVLAGCGGEDEPDTVEAALETAAADLETLVSEGEAAVAQAASEAAQAAEQLTQEAADAAEAVSSEAADAVDAALEEAGSPDGGGGGGGGTPPAGETVFTGDPCSVLTGEQVEAELGGTLTSAESDVPGVCVWYVDQPQDGGTANVSVRVEFGNGDSSDPFTPSPARFELAHPNEQPVDVGNRAHYNDLSEAVAVETADGVYFAVSEGPGSSPWRGDLAAKVEGLTALAALVVEAL